MALRWLVHSVCTSVFEYGKDVNVQYDHVGFTHPGSNVKSPKDPNEGSLQGKRCKGKCPTEFQMPLHYPRYKKADYKNMEEWKVDMLLREYGLNYDGTLDEKREFAIGAFLWPDQI